MKIKNYRWLGLVAIIVAVVIATVLVFDFPKSEKGVFPSGAVAIINGENLEGGKLNKRFEQMIGFYVSQGTDVSDPSMVEGVKSQVFEEMLNEILIYQYALENNIVVSEEEIDKEYDNIANQFGGHSEFEKEIALQGVGVREVRDDIKRNLIAESSILHWAGLEELSINEEEVQNLYSDYKEELGELPELEMVEDFLIAEIRNEKLNEFAIDFIQELMLEAEIEILI